MYRKELRMTKATASPFLNLFGNLKRIDLHDNKSIITWCFAVSKDEHNSTSCPTCYSRPLLNPHQVMVFMAPLLETGWVLVTALTNEVQTK